MEIKTPKKFEEAAPRSSSQKVPRVTETSTSPSRSQDARGAGKTQLSREGGLQNRFDQPIENNFARTTSYKALY
eukprot:1723409-Rhodomonas_salina.1